MSNNGEPKNNQDLAGTDIIKEIAEDVQIKEQKERGTGLSSIIAVMFFGGPVLSIIVKLFPDFLPPLIENISFGLSGIFLISLIVNAFNLSRS